MHTHIYSLSRAESRECRRLAAFTYGNTEDGIECENIFKLHCAGNSDGSQAVEVNCWQNLAQLCQQGRVVGETQGTAGFLKTGAPVLQWRRVTAWNSSASVQTRLHPPIS